jgi:MATE family multidrug resistance protein
VRWNRFARELGPELGPTLALAGPVVSAELGWMAMAIVDSLIVGRLGAEAIGAVGLGSMAFFTVVVFGMGLLLGLDTLVAQAFGAGDTEDCHVTLFQGVYLAAALTPPLMLAVLVAAPWLSAFDVSPGVLTLAIPYIRITAWSTFPLLIFAAVRRYLQATGHARPVMFALVSANLVNALGNWVLVYGHFGLPALGVEGSAWATTVSRLYMAGVVVGFTVCKWNERRKAADLDRARGPWWPDFARLRRLLGLGLPAALHLTLEVGVFALATALAGRMGAVSLAAHQVVLNMASVTFMIPFGLASAGAVRVGHALGRGDPPGAARAGWTTLALAAAFMALAGLTFGLAPRALIQAFTDDPRVLSLGVGLMYVAAAFQLFDGIQGVTTGNLRGLGDTHTPMACNLVAHWCLGLPVGYALAFSAGLGVLGLWIGLSLGLVAAGCVLLRTWVVRSRVLRRHGVDPAPISGLEAVAVESTR